MSFSPASGSIYLSISDFLDNISGHDFSKFLEFRNWRIQQIYNTQNDTNDILISWDKSELNKDSEFFYTNSKDQRMDSIYLRMAKVWGENSYCTRMKVGCLVVNQKSIISDGYNGSPSGFPNQCESEDNITLPHILHAEANAITKIAKSTQSSYGSTLYVTLSPCFECSKLIIQSGIKRVVFNELYRKTDSIPFLVRGGVEILKIEPME